MKNYWLDRREQDKNVDALAYRVAQRFANLLLNEIRLGVVLKDDLARLNQSNRESQELLIRLKELHGPINGMEWV